MQLPSWLVDYWPHIIAAVTVATALASSCHAVLFKRDPRAAVLWLGFIWLVPILGPILYAFLGVNRVRRTAVMLRSAADRTAFIVNDIYPKSSISADQIEEHLTIKIGMTVPYDGENFLRAINEGQPIVSLARRSAAAGALRRLAEMLADTGAEDGAARPQKRGRLGGLLGRN